MTGALLEMRGIVKHYGAVRANDGIDLDVGRGRILGSWARTVRAKAR